MSPYRQAYDEALQSVPWQWHVMPLFIVAAALSTLLVLGGTAAGDEAAAVAVSTAAPQHAMQLVSSPQPGIGESELFARDLPQSY